VCYKRRGARSIVRLLAAAIVLAILLAGGYLPAWAQAGWYLTPSFQVSESFDDNIFGSPTNRQSDFVSRFSPGLEAGYRSEPFTLLAGGGFDAEVFARNPELNDATSGWHGGLNLQYLPTRPLTLGLNVGYTETRSLPTLTQSLTNLTLANPLNPANTVQQGRQKSTVFSASPTLAYQFTPLTSGNSSYSYTHSTFEGGATNTVHGAQLSVSHQVTRLDTGTLSYLLGVFESSGAPTEISNAFTLGWTRQFTPQTTVSLQAGPRFSDGSVDPEIHASLAHQFKLFDQLARASLAYSYTQGFVVGQAGPVNTQSLSGSLGFEPLRSLLVTVGSGVTRFSDGTGVDTTTYGVSAGASYQVLRWLTARATYSFSYQEQSTGNIPRNVVSVALEMAYPMRLPP